MGSLDGRGGKVAVGCVLWSDWRRRRVWMKGDLEVDDGVDVLFYVPGRSSATS